MKTLTIYAHPNHSGHHAYFLEQLTKKMELEKIDNEVLDLYNLNFNPVFSNEELMKSGETDLLIKNFQDKITEAEKLIFIFPTWWQGTPAIMKGFFDRVFSAGFAFEYQNGFPKGLLKGKNAAVFSATGGPKIINKLIMGNRGMKVVVNDTLKFCGIKARGFSVGSATKINDKKRVEILNQVNKMFNYLYKA